VGWMRGSREGREDDVRNLHGCPFPPPLRCGRVLADKSDIYMYIVHVRTCALPLFEVKGGLVSGTEASRGLITLSRPNRQWDFPFGWAPHQIVSWIAFEKYGFKEEARRCCYRWLYT